MDARPSARPGGDLDDRMLPLRRGDGEPRVGRSRDVDEERLRRAVSGVGAVQDVEGPAGTQFRGGTLEGAKRGYHGLAVVGVAAVHRIDERYGCRGPRRSSASTRTAGDPGPARRGEEEEDKDRGSTGHEPM